MQAADLGDGDDWALSSISSKRGTKKELAREKRRGKRAINEKQDHEI
jgi:hypothetical protein